MTQLNQTSLLLRTARSHLKRHLAYCTGMIWFSLKISLQDTSGWITSHRSWNRRCRHNVDAAWCTLVMFLWRDQCRWTVVDKSHELAESCVQFPDVEWRVCFVIHVWHKVNDVEVAPVDYPLPQVVAVSPVGRGQLGQLDVQQVGSFEVEFIGDNSAIVVPFRRSIVGPVGLVE